MEESFGNWSIWNNTKNQIKKKLYLDNNNNRQVKPHKTVFPFLQLDMEVGLICFCFLKPPEIEAAEYVEISLLNYPCSAPFHVFCRFEAGSWSVFTGLAQLHRFHHVHYHQLSFSCLKLYFSSTGPSLGSFNCFSFSSVTFSLPFVQGSCWSSVIFFGAAFSTSSRASWIVGYHYCLRHLSLVLL